MFRINHELARSQGNSRMRSWSVKVPSGLYAILRTNEAGKGLLIAWMGSTYYPDGDEVLPENEFMVPADMERDDTVALLDKALNQIW